MAYDDFEDKSFKVDENYFNVVIPDLDPGKDVPVQFRWQYNDNTYGDWSASKILQVPEISRPEVTNIVAVWEGTNLKITWDKASDLVNAYQIYLTNGGITRSWTHPINKNSTQQTWVLTEDMNKNNFGLTFRTSFTGVLRSTYIDNTTVGVDFTTPAFVDEVCIGTIADSEWLVTSIQNGITVAWQGGLTTQPTYATTEVYVATSSSGPYELKYTGSGPATIILDNFNVHYIKIAHVSKSGCTSSFSNVKTGTAYDPIVFDEEPPNEVTSVTGVWSGDDILVSFTMPAADPAKRFRIYLTNGSETRFFDKFAPAQTGSQSVRILDSELFGAFGERYTSFTGSISSVDEYENKSTGVAFTVAEKTNPLSGVTPTAVVTAMSNGYTVSWTLPSGAAYAKVYEGATSGFTPDDNTNLVYSGDSPAVVVNTNYIAVFVKIKYFNNFGSASNASSAYEVTPLDAGMLSVISNPVEIQTGGSILAGDQLTSGARFLINETGAYVYDASATVGTGPTTQIIGNATSGSPTFITTNAKIANWKIYTNKIENELGGGVTKYAGLSPNGTYAFWAGSTTAGGDSSAKFIVSQAGELTARDVNIVGGQLTVGGTTYANSPFAVNSSGTFKATDATITGTINATAGNFTGSLQVGTGVSYGQFRLNTPSGAKFEIGALTNTGGSYTGDIGIQGTNSGNQYFQLDTVNGIITNKGTIGGWTIDANSINKNNVIGLYNTTTSTDVAIWAGGTRGGTNKFSVTYGGKLVATDASIYGNVYANVGGFGTFNALGTAIENGWTISSATITSTGSVSGTGQVILDGQNGSISGGKISGTKVLASAFYVGSSESATDYIKSDGTLSLANGLIYYNGSMLQINQNRLGNTQFKIKLNVTSNEDGTFGDSTLVQAEDGEMTIGRAFFYGGTTDPRVGYFGGAVTARWQVDNGNQGSLAFNKGDIWFQRAV